MVNAKDLYSDDVALRPTFDEERNTRRDVLGETGETIAKAERSFVADVVKSSGLDPYGIGAKLYQLHVSAAVAKVRGQELDPGQVQAWNEAARAELRGTYGPERSEKLLQQVETFVAAHPKLKAVLSTHGIGSRPEIVRKLVEHVRRLG